MRELTDDFKLFFRSTGEINEAFSAIVSRAKSDRSIRLELAGQDKAKKANRTTTLNAVVLWLASRDEAEQKRILREGMRLLSDHLNDADAPAAPIDGAPDTIKAPPPRRVSVRELDATPKRRKGTRGA